MNDDIAIKVEGVNKTFKLPHEKSTSIKTSVINFYKHKKGYEKQQALKDISFEVKKGEFFGIVGRNGSGKSTLLKIISKIYTPDSGDVQVNGKLTPFIELGVGFNPELSGRENVFLNGALLGFSRKEMNAMYDEIVEFAELERFMDQKLKNYSSGMQVRLAFSIAIRANSDILVLDEVLAVGDESFQKKCFDYFTQLKSKEKTVVLVTHDMNAVERFCDRAILINEGIVQIEGEPREISYRYKMLNLERSTKKGLSTNNSWGTKEIEIKDVSLISKTHKQDNNTVRSGQKASVQIKINNNKKTATKINYSLAVNHHGVKCFDISTFYREPIKLDPLTKRITIDFEELPLLPGEYSCDMTIFDESMNNVHHGIKDAFNINVIGDTRELGSTGVVLTKWEIYTK